jgi:hypothetical protein
MTVVAPGTSVQLVTDVPPVVAGHSISQSAIKQAISTTGEEMLLNFFNILGLKHLVCSNVHRLC